MTNHPTRCQRSALASLDRLRRDALAAFRAAVGAVEPQRFLRGVIAGRGRTVSVAGVGLPDVPGRRVVAALGKAAPGLAAGWMKALPGWASEVLVLAPHGVPVPAEVAAQATVLRGSHPTPDAAGEAAARRLLGLAGTLGRDDLLVVLLSGGASALLAVPVDGVDLDTVRRTTRSLLAAGAPIQELNTVRRQLLAAAGGGLARAAAPAQVVTLVLSDVIGDPLADIASGPTVTSPTGPLDALAVLERRRLAAQLPEVVALLVRQATSPMPAPAPGRVGLLATNRTAVDAAAGALRGAGYGTVTLSRPLLGEATARGRQLGALAVALRPAGPFALVAGGETTVTVRGEGRGGRCQELALAAALTLEGSEHSVLLAAGTDGVDGVTPNAGGLVDGATTTRLRALGVDPVAALAANDSGSALAAVGDALVTGPTGTNVADLVLLLTTPAPTRV